MVSPYKKTFVTISLVLCLFSTVFAKYSGGTGNSNSPYQIGTVSDWQELMATSADWAKHFIFSDRRNGG